MRFGLVGTSFWAREVHAAGIRAADEADLVGVWGRDHDKTRDLAASMEKNGPWRGADAMWLASAFAEGSPFNTPWRHEKGALWDVGPHILAALTDGLGPISDVLAAARGAGDLIHVVVQHETGATSTFTATLMAPRAVGRQQLRVWGDRTVVEMPHSSQPPSETFAVAVGELVRSAGSGRPHRLDVAFGRDLVALLARAEELAGPPSVV